MSSRRIFAIIPARAGSRRVPGKNIKLLAGYPLIAYSVIAARQSRIERTLVSTDSQEIADIAAQYGAEVPFLRPSELSQDNSTDLSVVRHTLSWFESKRQTPYALIFLRPTTPLRLPKDINRATKYFEDSPAATSLRSAHRMPEPVHKMFRSEGDYFKGLFPDDPRPEYHNLPSHMLPQSYHPNGYVDIIRPGIVQNLDLLWGRKILAFFTDPVIEIDTPESFEYLEYFLRKHGHWTLEFLRRSFPEVKDGF